MKIRMTVTVEIDNPNVYDLDDNGQAIGAPRGRIEREDVGEYVLQAVRIWGGSFAPDDPFSPSNIKSVRVQGTGFDVGKELKA